MTCSAKAATGHEQSAECHVGRRTYVLQSAVFIGLSVVSPLITVVAHSTPRRRGNFSNRDVMASLSMSRAGGALDDGVDPPGAGAMSTITGAVVP
jgi:hypothetical protein